MQQNIVHTCSGKEGMAYLESFDTTYFPAILLSANVVLGTVEAEYTQVATLLQIKMCATVLNVTKLKVIRLENTDQVRYFCKITCM